MQEQSILSKMKYSDITGERNKYGLYELKYNDEVIATYPSVTTILATIEDPDVLEIQNNLSKEQWDFVSKRGCDRGTAMHLFFENYSKALKEGKDEEEALLYTQKNSLNELREQGIEEDFIKMGRDFFYNIFNESDYTKEVANPILMEGLLFSREYGYAGRVDLVYQDNEGNIVIGDYKTSSQSDVPDYKMKILKYKMQIAAYAMAFYEITKKMPDYGKIWMASSEGHQEFVVHKSELTIFFEAFKSALKKYNDKHKR